MRFPPPGESGGSVLMSRHLFVDERCVGLGHRLGALDGALQAVDNVVERVVVVVVQHA